MRNLSLGFISTVMGAGMVTILACGGSYDPPARVPFSPTVYDCSMGELAAAPTLVPVTGGGTGGAGGAYTKSEKAIPVEADQVIRDWDQRRRAAIICACRAKEARASLAGPMSDTLTVLGGVGTIGGGVVSGIAASVKDEDTRSTLAKSGAVSLGVGAVAFGINTALNLNGRAKEYAASATQQEQAAAILLNDKADPKSWGEAWLACTNATDTAVAARRDEPQQYFAHGGASALGGTGGAGGTGGEPSAVVAGTAGTR